MRLTEDLYNVGFRARHFFDTPAPERWNLLLARLNEYGGELRLHTCAQTLVMKDGKVCGVETEDTESHEQILADQPLSVGGELTLRAGNFYAVLDEELGHNYVWKGGRNRPFRIFSGRLVRNEHWHTSGTAVVGMPSSEAIASELWDGQ